ncbi:hypothetical protein NKH52_21085 [Mesorhizobium sp. M1066]|uniref:hypothetical protein n=1 Tax=unclassified Mesorhizobium TaxID=325217 RepID=UPI00333CDBAC
MQKPYSVQLTSIQSEAFVRQFYLNTNPIKPFEAEIIQNILQTDVPQHDWRTLNHIFCKGCRRELTALDLFLSGLKQHSPKFIDDYLHNGASGGGEVAYSDGRHCDIQVFHHDLHVVCIQCGTEMDEATPQDHIYGYKRPKRPIGVISVSVKVFNWLVGKADEDLARQPRQR